MTTDVFVAIANYGPEDDVPALVAVGFTAALANAALQSLIDDSDEPELWIAENAESHTVAEEPASDPAWRQCSPEDQERLAIAQIEEVNDCSKEIAHDMLDAMSAEEVEDMLQALKEDEAGVI